MYPASTTKWDSDVMEALSIAAEETPYVSRTVDERGVPREQEDLSGSN